MKYEYSFIAQFCLCKPVTVATLICHKIITYHIHCSMYSLYALGLVMELFMCANIIVFLLVQCSNLSDKCIDTCFAT